MSQVIAQLDHFLEELARQGKPTTTIRAYRFDLVSFGRYFATTTGEPFRVEAITPTDVRDYKAHLLTVEGRKPATINRHLASLKSFCGWALAEGLISELPTDRVKGVQGGSAGPKWLEKREVHRLLRAVERSGIKRDLAIVSTLYHTGLRVQELCQLRLADVELSERKGSLIVRAGKGGKYRVIPLNADVRTAIGDYLAVRPKALDDQLFLSQRLKGLKPRMVEYLAGNHARLAGLEGVTPHTLRHSFCKHALDAGVNLVEVSKLAGHRRLETTAIYTTPSYQDLEKSVSRLERDHVAISRP